MKIIHNPHTYLSSLGYYKKKILLVYFYLHRILYRVETKGGVYQTNLKGDLVEPFEVDFYEKHVNIKLKDKVCLINAPMSNKRMNQLYTVKFLGNVVGGGIIKYANVDIDDMKNAAMKSIINDEAVWFGCDVGKMFHRDLGIMDMDLYDYELLFNTTFNMTKQDKLEYGDSVMTHAMLITAVDIKNNKYTP